MSLKLAKAKSALILDQPFFASLLLGIPMQEDKTIDTFATNGDWIKYNPVFLESLSLSEVIFVLAHETMHCAFQHMYRREHRDPNKWNIATDYIINDLLTKENIGCMPQGGLLNPQLVKAGNGNAEGVYKLLPDSDKDKRAGKPDEGGSIDEISDPCTDPAELQAKEADTKVRVIQAANAAKAQGKLSSNLKRLVSELVKPATDWKQVLRRFLSERAKIDLSYAKPKRRFMADDLYLPSPIGERLGEIVVAVDCSGSIDDETLRVFSNELNAIKTDTNPSKVTIVYFDSIILKTNTFGSEDTLKIEPCGGGGTAFSPVIEYINTLDTQPVAVVFLTDLCCNDFGTVPSYPVLWATTDQQQAPFGEIVKVKV